MSKFFPLQIAAKIANKLGFGRDGKLTQSRAPAPDVSEELRSPEWLPDWKSLIQAEERVWKEVRLTQSQKVLVATIAGGHPACIGIESLIGVALALRGVDVHFLLCDGALPACLQCTANQFPNMELFLEEGPKSTLCNSCFSLGRLAFDQTGLPIRKLSDYISAEDIAASAALAARLTVDDFPELLEDEVGIGEHVVAGALRFFASGSLASEQYGLTAGRKFVEAAYLSKLAAERLYDQEEYDAVFMNHGIYVPHGIIKEVAQKRNMRTSVWWLAAKERCVHLNHKDVGVFTMLDEPTSLWEDMQWSDAAEKELLDYLESRWTGCRDWFYHGMHEGSQADVQALAAEFKIDFSKPTIGMLTNVFWDAALFYPANVFPSQLDWLIDTIRYFSTRENLNLIIRVHPAEVKDTMESRQTAVGEISKVFPVLPSNVFLVPPESKANTYALMSQCDSVIIYGTTTGMELTSMGIPTITAGEAFIKNKGITIDPKTPSEYFEVLDRLPLRARMSPEQTRRARMYAYNYYFRRSVPLSAAKPVKGWPPIKIELNTLLDLMPGRDIGLDVICDGILKETEFIYPAEKVVLQRKG